MHCAGQVKQLYILLSPSNDLPKRCMDSYPLIVLFVGELLSLAEDQTGKLNSILRTDQ
jgi:hypothetical protein